MLLEKVVEISNELIDSLSHMHMANFGVNGIRVGECHSGVFICSHSGLELVSAHLSDGKGASLDTYEYFVPSSTGSRSLLIA